MGGNPKDQSLFSMIVMAMIAATPLIAVPTAMLTMSPRETDSINKPQITPKETSTTQKKTTKQNKSTKASKQQESPSDQLLRDFLGRSKKDSIIGVQQEVLSEGNSKFNFRGLIVTLPDPQDSSLVYLFDA
jgi:short subunit fatty acids transporter